MHVVIAGTKGHAASKADAASQHVLEHFTAQSGGKKARNATTIPNVTQHPFAFP